MSKQIIASLTIGTQVESDGTRLLPGRVGSALDDAKHALSQSFGGCTEQVGHGFYTSPVTGKLTSEVCTTLWTVFEDNSLNREGFRAVANIVRKTLNQETVLVTFNPCELELVGVPASTIV